MHSTIQEKVSWKAAEGKGKPKKFTTEKFSPLHRFALGGSSLL